MRRTLSDGHHPGLRKRRAFAPVHTRTTKELIVHDTVHNIKSGPINGDQPPLCQPRPRRRLQRKRLRDPTEQCLQRLGTKTLTGLKDRRLTRQHQRLRTRLRPAQTISQQPKNVLIGPLRMQRHPDREVRHHPRRQRPIPLLGPATPGDHLINKPQRKRPRQHPHRHKIRQPPLRLWASSIQHESPINYTNVT